MNYATGAQSLASSPSADRRVVRHWAWWTAAVAVAILAYGPLLGIFFRQQWQKPHYQYFPFVIAAFAWLLWQRIIDSEPRVPPREGGRWLNVLALTFAVGLLVTGIALRSPWAAIASLISLTAYVFRQVSRSRHVTNLWGIWFLLWLLAPLPFGADQWLITKLQALSSRISSSVLDILGVNHVMEGNTLWIPAKQLFVDEACSGIVSILSVVACAVIFAVIKNRTPMHMAALALAGIMWATVVNVGRISIIALALDRWGIDWSAGMSHEILSLTLFLVTFLALLSTDRILEVCLEPVAARWHERHAADLGFGAGLAAVWDYLVALGRPRKLAAETTPLSPHEPSKRGSAQRSMARKLAVIFAIPAMAQWAILAYAFHIAPENLDVLPRARMIDSQNLPATLCGLQQAEFTRQDRDTESIFGKHSRTYEYRDPNSDERYMVSFDFPFANGWHELTVCYKGNGWAPKDRKVRRALEVSGEAAWDYVEADFDKPGGECAFLAFSLFDQYGDPLRPYIDWLVTGDSFLGARNTYLRDRHGFQVQVWVVRNGVVSEANREKATELLLDVRRRFRSIIIAPANSTTAANQAALAK